MVKTKDNKTKEEKTKEHLLKEVNKYKIYSSQKLSTNGENLKFTLELNEPLRKLIKKVIVEEGETATSISLSNRYGVETEVYNFHRYKVKGILFRELYGSYKELLFDKTLLDKGKVNLKVFELSRVNSIVSGIRENVNKIISFVLKSEVKQEHNFILNLETEGE